MAFGVSRIFKSTDVSAPQFGLTSGAFKNMLKAVLATGYGTIESLGWTIEYEVGNVIVFRMKGGTRMYLRLDDNTISTEYATGFSAFSTMNSINTGTERIPAIGISSASFRKRVGGTANVPWMIIGDDAGFILLTKPRYVSSSTDISQNLWNATYFGDYIPADVKNKWNFCLISTYSSTGIHKHAQSTSISHLVQRDQSFKTGASYCGISSFVNGANYFGQWLSVSGNLGVSSGMVGGAFLTTPVIVYKDLIGTTANSCTSLLGFLPGMRDPVMSDGGSGAYITIDSIAPVTITDDDGYSMLLYIDSMGSSSQPTYGETASKLVFRIGKGFRNV